MLLTTLCGSADTAADPQRCPARALHVDIIGRVISSESGVFHGFASARPEINQASSAGYEISKIFFCNRLQNGSLGLNSESHEGVLRESPSFNAANCFEPSFSASSGLC